MSTLIRTAAVAALLLASTAGVVQAASPATPEGAAAIRAGLEGWIAEWLGGADGSTTVVFSAPIAVAAQGSFYAVKVPSLTATIAGPDEGATMTIALDAVELRLAPQSETLWAVDWRLPATIGLQGADGTGVEIAVGSQSGRGTYSTALDTFTTLDVRLGDIAAAPVAPRPGEDEQVAIDALVLTLATEEGAGGLWDAQATLGLRGLFVRDRDEYSDTKVTLAAFDGHVGATGLDVPALLAFLQGIARADLPAATASGPGALDGVADLMETTPKLLDTFGIGWSMTGFGSSDQYGRLDVGGAGVAVAIDGVRAETASAHITAGMTELDTPDLGVEDLTPRRINVDLTIEAVPSEVMTGALKEFFRGTASMGPEAALEIAGMQVYAALTNGDGVVRFDELLVDFPRVGIDLSGRVWSAEKSMVGFAADMILTIGGYKALYELLAALAGSDAGPDGEVAQFLTAFELLGQPAVDDQGRPGRRYQLVIDEATGAVTFNGTNIETLIP